MILVTGDTHGDFTRFRADIFPEQADMTKEDYVIICGDFGLWDDSAEEHEKLDWLEGKPFTTLFVAGNHSNYDLLATFPVSEWYSGKVQHIRPSVIHLMRGASSHDISAGILEPDDPDFAAECRRLDEEQALYRVNHVSWWREELPSDAEYAEALRSLDAWGWQVDYIISHCCSSSLEDRISGGFYQHDRLTDFFEELGRRCTFRNWFFGHYHDNQAFEQEYVLLYEPLLITNASPHASHVLVLCGGQVDEAVKNEIAVAQRLNITATTLEGILTVRGQGHPNSKKCKNINGCG